MVLNQQFASIRSSALAYLRSLLGLCTLLAHTLCVSAAVPSNPDLTARFLEAAQKLDEARRGSAAATPLAQAAFRDLLAADPQNPLYMAYCGSTFALQARDGRVPWRRISQIHESIATIKQALRLLRPEDDHEQTRGIPVSLEARLVAIATFDALPETFHMLPAAKQQLALAMENPVFASAPAEMRGRYYYEVAFIAAADGEVGRERVALRQVLAYAPASLDLTEVSARLAKLGG
jgi:hypothetical protein